MSTETFIQKARLVHGERYDYSKTVYLSTKDKICIIDPEYGEFWQRPLLHLKGQTPRIRKRVENAKTKEQFVIDARKVHGDLYSYDKVEYKTARIKVCIIDPEYGEFWQAPTDHLNGKGSMARSGRMKKTTELFVDQARKIHGDVYDYSRVDYVNGITKVCIIDPEHGEFWQVPNSHLAGRGSPYRSSSLGERRIKQWLETNDIKFIPQKKFPTCRNPKTGRQLRYDFYLPDHDLLIEYQGEIHDKPQCWWTKDTFRLEKEFEERKYRDVVKCEWAASNGIQLVEIWYHEDYEAKLGHAVFGGLV